MSEFELEYIIGAFDIEIFNITHHTAKGHHLVRRLKLYPEHFWSNVSTLLLVEL